MANIIIVLGVSYTSKHTCKQVRICSKCSETNCQPLPIFTGCCKQCFGSFRNSTCFRNHLSNGVCDNSKSCDSCGQWFIGPVLEHVCRFQRQQPTSGGTVRSTDLHIVVISSLQTVSSTVFRFRVSFTMPH